MTTDDQLRHLVARSVEVIAEHQHVGGAYLASPTFKVYRYSWLRDGAFIADAMSRAGEVESAERFFDWCARTLSERAGHVRTIIARAEAGETIAHDEHPPTRYTVDGRDTGEQWWDFQLDGYGTWMWAFAEHRKRHGTTVGDPPIAAVELCADYLAAFWRQPCYDWWEEHADHIHTSTLAAVHAGLNAAAGIQGVSPETASVAADTAKHVAKYVHGHCVANGHLVKMVGDTRVDASLVTALFPFEVVEPSSSIVAATYERIVEDLGPDGVHRYIGDTYFGGGRWVVLAGFVGWFEAATGRTEQARARLEWMHGRATPDGHLPEQITDHSLEPDHIEPWVDRWGPVATPLLWSHAMFITLADALGLTKEPRHV